MTRDDHNETNVAAQKTIDTVIEYAAPFFEETEKVAARDIFVLGQVTEKTMRMRQQAIKDWWASMYSDPLP